METNKSDRQWAMMSGIRAGLGICHLCEPATVEQLQEAVSLHPESVILGNGSNFIGADSDGYSIRLANSSEFTAIRQEGAIFSVGAAVSLTMFLKTAAESGFGGFSALSGIPGTMGGCVKMNAGALGVEISPTVRRINGVSLSNGTCWSIEPSAGDWAYRNSPIPDNVIVTDLVMELEGCDALEEQTLIQAELRRRKKVTPVGASCGSVFRNPSKETPAGMLLEQAGCKGLAVGAFSVSLQHANWIVNLSRVPASAADCLKLLRICQEKVFEKFGVELQPEWRICSK